MDFKAGKLPIRAENISFSNEGILRISWNQTSPIEIEENDVMFTIILNADNGNLLSEHMILLQNDLKAEAYSSTGEISSIAVDFRNEVKETESRNYFLAEPNPFTEDINLHYNLIQDGPVQINFIDLSGKLIHRIEKVLNAGEHHENVQLASLTAEKLIICQLIASNQSSVQKIVRLK
jgi:hypothetical protein